MPKIIAKQKKADAIPWGGVVLVILLVMSWRAYSAPPPVDITYTITTVAPTCEIERKDTNGAVLTLNNVPLAAFSQSAAPAKSSGKTITINLKNCAGVGGGQVPAIKVWGDRDAIGTSTTLYRGGGSQAQNVGFVLTNNTTGDGTPLKAGTQASPTIVNVPGANGSTLPNGKTVDFFVQVSRDNFQPAQVTSGSLTARLHFDFTYN